jgi:hypothetical protein
MTMQNTAKVDTTPIPLDQLHPFPGNPNEEDAITFNNLVDEIDQDGFDQPLIVVPAANILGPGATGYVVVSGNHRYKALQTQGKFDAVDCVIKDWDAEKAKIKVVRRNLLSGDLNAKKFTAFVDGISTGYTQDQLADAMGFASVEDFTKIYQKELEEQNERGKEGAADARNEMNLIDGLSLILNRLLREYGQTVAYSFMFFLYGSKIHLCIQANTKLKRLLEIITKRCVEDGLDINLALTGLLGVGIQHTNFEKGPPERTTIEAVAQEGQDEEHELTAVTGSSAGGDEEPPEAPTAADQPGQVDQEALDDELRQAGVE